jgi:uncharacterized protein (DUF305 family)
MSHDYTTRWIATLVLLLASLAVACNDSSSRSENPLMPGGRGNQGGMGGMGPGMGGMGMRMSVASEFDYLAQMIPHHEEAVHTGGLLGRGTERQEMRDFAANIIRTQTAEIEQMRAWLEAWYPGRDTRVDYRPMMRDLTGLQGDALDRAFLQDMIPHHMMAVMMSQQLLNATYSRHDEVIPFAQTIRDVQRAEIQMMQRWLNLWW